MQHVYCRDYASAEFVPAHDEGKFDYIAVDGRSRMLCLKRALKLLKPEVLPPVVYRVACIVPVNMAGMDIPPNVQPATRNITSNRQTHVMTLLNFVYAHREASCCWTTQVHLRTRFKWCT